MLGHCSGPTELQDELLKQHGMELLQSCLAWTLVLIRQHKTAAACLESFILIVLHSGELNEFLQKKEDPNIDALNTVYYTPSSRDSATGTTDLAKPPSLGIQIAQCR